MRTTPVAAVICGIRSIVGRGIGAVVSGGIAIIRRRVITAVIRGGECTADKSARGQAYAKATPSETAAVPAAAAPAPSRVGCTGKRWNRRGYQGHSQSCSANFRWDIHDFLS
jgi:hypothetical protein